MSATETMNQEIELMRDIMIEIEIIPITIIEMIHIATIDKIPITIIVTILIRIIATIHMNQKSTMIVTIKDLTIKRNIE